MKCFVWPTKTVEVSVLSDAGRYHDGRLCVFGRYGINFHYHVSAEILFFIESISDDLLYCYYWMQSDMHVYSLYTSACGNLFYSRYIQNVGYV